MIVMDGDHGDDASGINWTWTGPSLCKIMKSLWYLSYSPFSRSSLK